MQVPNKTLNFTLNKKIMNRYSDYATNGNANYNTQVARMQQAPGFGNRKFSLSPPKLLMTSQAGGPPIIANEDLLAVD